MTTEDMGEPRVQELESELEEDTATLRRLEGMTFQEIMETDGERDLGRLEVAALLSKMQGPEDLAAILQWFLRETTESEPMIDHGVETGDVESIGWASAFYFQEGNGTTYGVFVVER